MPRITYVIEKLLNCSELKDVFNETAEQTSKINSSCGMPWIVATQWRWWEREVTSAPGRRTASRSRMGCTRWTWVVFEMPFGMNENGSSWVSLEKKISCIFSLIHETVTNPFQVIKIILPFFKAWRAICNEPKFRLSVVKPFSLIQLEFRQTY